MNRLIATAVSTLLTAVLHQDKSAATNGIYLPPGANASIPWQYLPARYINVVFRDVPALTLLTPL